MNRLVLMLVCSLLAAFIGTLIARDPGYVLVSYGEYLFQTSLWIMVLLIGISFIGLHYFLRSLKFFLRGSADLRKWNYSRKTSKADDYAREGLLLFAEGQYSRAEQFLLKGISIHPYPAYLYLVAAKAAEGQNNPQKRELLLRKARESESRFTTAVAITAAEMANARGDWKVSLNYLENIPDTDISLGLKRDALMGQHDWKSLQALMPSLQARRLNDVDFEKRFALRYLRNKTLSDESRKALMKKASASVREDPDIVLQYISSLSEEKVAEVSLRKIINRGSWRSDYILAYSNLGRETLLVRLKFANSWLKNHSTSPDLQLALAKMYLNAGDTGKARQACFSSIQIRPSKAALEMMATFLSDEGNYKESNKYFKRALDWSALSR
ncbi:MAG: heme biosynthesis HemY N-terminal domain-containing protein [Candidatus Azotimanducaceae bacterium]|uniref:HemY N-terminal domain-containing protein n=1 Tax=OM182 bacterium TaxID=2510334 RepID=A0A520S5S1_9GAMM|nr:MAG: hypothetical protein EVA68_00675 [OM182 bacterium]